MASRQSVSSILKPPKVRAPLKEIEPVDQDADENTASLPKRKVSFSGMNKIKMYNTGATSLTVHQAPMFDEQISLLSDSSNADKTKLSGKFEKSDDHITFESTNCTNVEDNGRIILEYESPSDNMEMTEALSGKIFSDTIYTIDNNGSEHIDCSSESNMDFTEAIKGGQIIIADNEYDSTEMSETLIDKNVQTEVIFDLETSKSLPNVVGKNTFNFSSHSSGMDFTCADTKSSSMDLSCVNTQSSNMELTCMTAKSQKCIWSNDDNELYRKEELIELTYAQTHGDNYEYRQDSINMESEESYETNENSSCEPKIVQNDILYDKRLEFHNYSNNQNFDCVFISSDCDKDVVEQLSLSVVSMDIDPTLENNEYDISYVNVDNPELVANEQDNQILPATIGIESRSYPMESVQDNFSNVIDNHKNSTTDLSTVQQLSSENKINNSVVVEEQLLQKTLTSHISELDQNKSLWDNVPIEIEKKYSRKTMVHTAPLIVQEESYESDDISDKYVLMEESQKKICSRKSIAPATVFNHSKSYKNDVLPDTSISNQTQFYEKEDSPHKSVMKKENQQKVRSRKSIAPTSVFNQSRSYENEVSPDTSLGNQSQTFEKEDLPDKSIMMEENKTKVLSRKSIAPTSVFNQSRSYENEVSLDNIGNQSLTFEKEDSPDKSIMAEENQQKVLSRKSIAPTSVFNQSRSYENEVSPDTSLGNQSQTFEKQNSPDKSMIVEVNQQKVLSRKSIAPTSVFNQSKFYENDVLPDTSISNQTQFYEKEDSPDKSVMKKENQQKVLSRKSIAPTSVFNQSRSYENEVSPDTSLGNQSQTFEKQNSPDKSMIVEVNQQKVLSRKSIANTSVFNQSKFYENDVLPDTSISNQTQFYEKEDSPDKSVMKKENQQKVRSRKSIAPTSVFNQSRSYENEVSPYTSIGNQSQTFEKEDSADKSMMTEENQLKVHYRKSISPTSVFNQRRSYENEVSLDTSIGNQSQSFEKEDLPDKSVMKKENQQKVRSRKSIAPTSIFNQSRSYENEVSPDTSLGNESQTFEKEDSPDKSMMVEENQQKVCSRKSIAPTSVFNQSRSYENEVSLDISIGNQSLTFEKEDSPNKSIMAEENQQKVLSRKSIAPTSVFNQSRSYENEVSPDTSLGNESQTFEKEDSPDKSMMVEENQQKVCSRKSIAPTSVFNQSRSYENEVSLDTSIGNQSLTFEKEDSPDKSIMTEENQQKVCSRKSIAPTFVFNHSRSYENEVLSDESVMMEEIQQEICSRKSIASTSVFNQSHSSKNVDLSDISIHNQTQSIVKEKKLEKPVKVDEIQQKRYTRKSIGPTCSIFARNESLDNCISDNSLMVEESFKSSSRMPSVVPEFINDISFNSNNCNTQPTDISNFCIEQITPISIHQSIMLNVSDNDFNSPFRKKSRKSIDPMYYAVQIQPNKKTFDEFMKSFSNEQEYKSVPNEFNLLEDVENVSKMNISIEVETANDNKANFSSEKTNITLPLSSLGNDLLHIEKIYNSAINEVEESNKSLTNNDLQKVTEVNKNNYNDVCEIDEEKTATVPIELEKNEKNLEESVEINSILKNVNYQNEKEYNNKSTKSIDGVSKTNQALNTKDISRCSINISTNEIYVEDLSNMSISDKVYLNDEKSFVGNRKRSHSNRNCIPLSSSTFVSKPNIQNSTSEDFMKASPIKKDVTKEDLIDEASIMKNNIEIDPIKEVSVKEYLSKEVLEFLKRWNDHFVEEKLTLEKCTNNEWVFNILNSNLFLIITYSPIFNDHSFLKVENISFTTNTITQNEIIQFGINWILSKYNPKVYKQICFTSRDVELLLKSLLDDVQFINEVIKNMFYVSDMYCVTFKDNKAQFVLHKMKPSPLMVRFEVLLCNIHKLSIKDITIDCLFGFFNTNLLDKVMQNITKDCNVLQYLIENIDELISIK